MSCTLPVMDVVLLLILSMPCTAKKGGLATQRHNEVRDALGDLDSMEPMVKEAKHQRRYTCLDPGYQH